MVYILFISNKKLSGYKSSWPDNKRKRHAFGELNALFSHVFFFIFLQRTLSDCPLYLYYKIYYLQTYGLHIGYNLLYITQCSRRKMKSHFEEKTQYYLLSINCTSSSKKTMITKTMMERNCSTRPVGRRAILIFRTHIKQH